MNEIEMEIKNEDGVLIKKSVPINLVPDYETMGWKLVEKKKKPIFTSSKKEEE